MGQLSFASVFISFGANQVSLMQYANNPQSWFFLINAFRKTETVKEAILKLPNIPSVRCICKGRE